MEAVGSASTIPVSSEAASLTSILANQKQIEDSINAYQQILLMPNAPQDIKDTAQSKIAELNKQLATLTGQMTPEMKLQQIIDQQNETIAQLKNENTGLRDENEGLRVKNRLLGTESLLFNPQHLPNYLETRISNSNTIFSTRGSYLQGNYGRVLKFTLYPKSLLGVKIGLINNLEKLSNNFKDYLKKRGPDTRGKLPGKLQDELKKEYLMVTDSYFKFMEVRGKKIPETSPEYTQYLNIKSK